MVCGGKARPGMRKRRMYLTLVSLAPPALLCCLAALTPPAGFAVCGEVVAVTPTRIPLGLSPGEESCVEAEVINQGDCEVTLIARVASLLDDEGGETVLSMDEKCSWITPHKEEISLLPGAGERCPFTVRVPRDAPQGSHRFALCFEPARGGGEEGVGFTGGVAVLLELEVRSAPEGAEESGGRFPTAAVAIALLGAALVAASTVFFTLRGRGRGIPGGGGAGGL